MNLHLLVRPGGSRQWVWRGTVKHVGFKNYGVGPFPVVTLKEARETALEMTRMARKGIDPKKPTGPTFAAVAKLWEAERAKSPWTDTRNYQTRLRTLMLPTMGAVPIDKVTATHVRTVIDKATSISQAKRAVHEIGEILDHAILQELRMAANPCPGLQKSIKQPDSTKRVAMEPEALRESLPQRGPCLATVSGVRPDALW